MKDFKDLSNKELLEIDGGRVSVDISINNSFALLGQKPVVLSSNTSASASGKYVAYVGVGGVVYVNKYSSGQAIYKLEAEK